MICKQCNNTVPSDSEYCPFCGNTIEKIAIEPKVVSNIEKGYTYLELKEWEKAKEVFNLAILNNDNKAKAYIGRLLAKLKLSDFESLSKINKKLTKFDDFKMAVKYADNSYEQELKKCYYLVERRRNKTKICALVLSVSCILLSVFAYFVLIPSARFSYYEKLLSNGDIQSATISFSKSKLFEFEEKTKELFYNNGILLIENKDYKNAEYCFDAIDEFKDSAKYHTYCKAQNLLAEKNLESYNYFVKCGEFLDSKEILETNEYFILLNKLQGEWYHPERSISKIDADMKKIGFRIDDSGKGYVSEIDGFEAWTEYVEITGEYGGYYSTRNRVAAKEETITFSGTECVNRGKIILWNDKLCVVGEDNAKYVDKFIEFSDDKNINFSYFKWTKK